MWLRIRPGITANLYQLTHLPLQPHICVSESDEHWFRKWLGAYSAPSHYLNQCLVIVYWKLRHTLQFKQDSNFFIQIDMFQNVVCQTVAIFSRWGGRWVQAVSPSRKRHGFFVSLHNRKFLNWYIAVPCFITRRCRSHNHSSNKLFIGNSSAIFIAMQPQHIIELEWSRIRT